MRMQHAILSGALLLTFAALVPAADQQQTVTKQDEKQTKQTFDAGRKTRVRLGAVRVGIGYTRFSGSGFYPYPYAYRFPYWYTPLFWDPFWSYYAPFYHPGFFTGFPYADDKGEVRLTAEPRQAEVFLDGAYAGTADHLKSIWLEPGAYSLSVRAANREPFEQRIYVLSGRTLRITAALPQKAEIQP